MRRNWQKHNSTLAVTLGMKTLSAVITSLLILSGSAINRISFAATDGSTTTPKLTARTFNSGFADAHDTYNGLSAASDGSIMC
jgi:hypothetical protein